jgi:hypothetical protein
MKALAILLVTFSMSLLAVLLVAAAKGFLTARGLIVDLPAQGRIFRLPLPAIFAIVLCIAILGVVMFFAGKRPSDKNFRPQDEKHTPNQ